MSLPPSNSGKSLASPPLPTHSPAGPTAASSSFEFANRRPTLQAGALGGGTVATPRKGQAARKQHRSQKRATGTGGGGGGGFGHPDDDDAMAEARALRNSSSRRGQTSITHLLNYAAPSRAYLDQAHDYRHRHHSGPSSHHGHHGHHGHHTAIDKARYVHANYRFVVSPTGDYTRQAADADEYVDWNDVLQILASTESQASSCPICLSEPVAPRMAKCGHIFCLSCLIRFMHASSEADDPPRNRVRPTNSVPGLTGHDGPHSHSQNRTPAPIAAPERKARWKKCPICEDSIYLAEVRPVRYYAGQECPLPRPGDDVVLRLMMRHADSIVALPRESGADVLNGGVFAEGSSVSGAIPWHFAVNVLDYAGIMKGTGDYMVEQFDRELEDLARQEKEDELLFHEDGEWSQRAARAVRAAQDKARELGGLEVALLGSTSGGGARAPAKAPGDRSNDQQQQQDFFFYSAPPHLYLSPLDIRILKTKYGSFVNFPSTLLPRVEHLSTGHVVDDAMRRRAKYLGHLPAGCVVSFLECDWTDIVPADILATFADDIERRRKRNRDKAFQEERERLQAERLEVIARRRGVAGAGAHAGHGRNGGGGGGALSAWDELDGLDGPDGLDGLDFDSDARPAVNMNDFLPLGDSSTAAVSSTPPNPRPGFVHLADMATSPTASGNAVRTVWGTRAMPGSPGIAAHDYVQDEVDDGWLRDEQLFGTLAGGLPAGENASGAAGSSDAAQAWAGTLSDADLAAQIAALNVASQSSGGGGGGSSSAPAVDATVDAPRNKKKKKQKITLMSTGGRRGI